MPEFVCVREPDPPRGADCLVVDDGPVALARRIGIQVEQRPLELRVHRLALNGDRLAGLESARHFPNQRFHIDRETVTAMDGVKLIQELVQPVGPRRRLVGRGTHPWVFLRVFRISRS